MTLSAKDHEAAVVAAVNAVEDGSALTPSDVERIKADEKQSLPAAYNEISVTERITDGPRRGGDQPSQTTQWRILIRSVAQRYGNAVEMRAIAREGLLEHVLTFGEGAAAQTTTEIEPLASDDPIAPDDGWFSGTSEFGYAL